MGLPVIDVASAQSACSLYAVISLIPPCISIANTIARSNGKLTLRCYSTTCICKPGHTAGTIATG
jgi:hypothetical protein